MTIPVPHALRIHVLSALQAGELPEGSLSVDQDVPLDGLGLPYLPRRRLVARLRDALDQVALAWPDEPTARARARLAGTSRSVGTARILVLGDGEISAAIRQSLQGLAARHDGTAGHGRLLAQLCRDAVTVVDTSTSADDYGAPLTGTRRDVRQVIAGVDFHVPLHWLEDPEVADLSTLARACLALRQIGGGESSGLGQVSVVLHWPGADPQADWDRTCQLAFDPPATHAPAPRAAQAASAPAAPADAEGSVTVTKYLQLKFRLGSDLVVDRRGPFGDAIPAPALRGALAARLRNEPGLLQDLVLDGNLRFSPAFPLITSGLGSTQISLPAPANMLLSDAGDVVDHFTRPEYTGRLKRLTGHYTADLRQRAAPVTATVQRLNRNTRLPFRSTVIRAGQEFGSEIAITGTEVVVQERTRQLQRVLARPLYVGGNARSGFGGELHTFGLVLQHNSHLAEELPDGQPGVVADVVLTSPALVRDAVTGQFTPAALPAAVQAMCARALGEGAVEVLEWHASPVTAGGFNARFGGLRPEHAAAAAGSVVRIRWNAAPDQEQLEQLAGHAVGQRTIDGFGQWRFAPEPPRAPARPVDAAVRTGLGDSGDVDASTHVLTVAKFQDRLNVQAHGRLDELIVQDLTGQLKGVSLDRGALGELRSHLDLPNPDVRRFLATRFKGNEALSARLTVPGTTTSIMLASFLLNPEVFVRPALTRYLRSWQLDPEDPGEPSPDHVARAASQLRRSCVEYLRQQAKQPPATVEGAPRP